MATLAAFHLKRNKKALQAILVEKNALEIGFLQTLKMQLLILQIN